ncbi:helix-turn-helix domain-containing protein [Paenibacillus roseipurpureus]|uniref:AraC family transcriptional regulator n=1 Tax=Paenibacillus roseopurpureus TaxID=2918901 RepID=A0AA96LWR9_9BACL|nr:AraC family transcriptional regulator [Paenibacillus sp. MBLB1832]WNR46090.1 AraC family transcriptional regulator [Paenibacillus sp. MBLB1832]
MKTNYITQKSLFTIGNISFITVQRPQGHKISYSEGRSQHSFIYTFSGTMCYSFEDPATSNIMAPAGQLVFLPSGTRHASTYLDTENEVGIAQWDLINGELPYYIAAPTLITFDHAEEIFSSFRTNLKAGVGDHAMYYFYRMYELLWHLSRKIQNIPYKYKKLQPALDEMTVNFADHRKISYYANMAGMSEPGFRRLFTEFTGLSPIDYRNQIRLQEAKKLLRSGEYRIDEAAEAIGFTNLSFFCRSYKRFFGHSPGKEK